MGMMSVNQLSVYHVALETRNVIVNNSSEDLQHKLLDKRGGYRLRSDERRDLTLPVRPKLKCTGFSYTGPKVWNKIPTSIRNNPKPESFKSMLKKWILDNIPS